MSVFKRVLASNTLILALGLAAVATGCASLSSGTPGQPRYAPDAQTNLDKGIEALDSSNYLEAQQYFEHVKSKYPFLEASKEAELRLAETDFRRERYAEARDLYRNFVKLHPTHAKVDLAAYQAALTHYKQIPSDFFAVPSSTEKDQTDVRSAATALSDFIRQYPDSQYKAEAEKTLLDVRKRLAQHERYVADFYKRRERWAAVAGRLERIVNDFPGTGFDEAAYLDLYDAYKKLGQKEKAEDTLKRAVQNLPGSDTAKKAQSLLGS